MKVLKSLSRKSFREQFGTSEQCLAYLSDVKWGSFYNCKKCKNDKYCLGKSPYNRRCSKCGYDEYPTANTLFHKVKFGIGYKYQFTPLLNVKCQLERYTANPNWSNPAINHYEFTFQLSYAIY